MDYFKEAFGGFDPQKDIDAALKFCLESILADCRFSELDKLLPDETNMGGMEGEPSWIIERRNEGETKGYESWPELVRFRAFVDPRGYKLAYPEFFCDKQTFEKFVESAIRAYCNRNPEHGEEVDSILKKISRIRANIGIDT